MALFHIFEIFYHIFVTENYTISEIYKKEMSFLSHFIKLTQVWEQEEQQAYECSHSTKFPSAI